MMQMRGLAGIYGLFLMFTLGACQRVIDIKVKSDSKLLVIEGNINNVTGQQTVDISQTVAYDAANVYPPVQNAVVTVNTNNVTYTLKENKPGHYTNTFRGRPGQVYNLTVKTGGQTYTAASVMPNAVSLDSVGVSAISVGKKSVKTVSAFYRDPDDEQNQYRFMLYVNGVQVKDIFTVNDYLTNGRYVNTTLYQDDIPLKAGDKVDVEMQCIDPNVYNYFYNLSHQGGNSPNNSATPTNPTSNVSNGALGYFSAFTVQHKSITVL